MINPTSNPFATWCLPPLSALTPVAAGPRFKEAGRCPCGNAGVKEAAATGSGAGGAPESPQLPPLGGAVQHRGWGRSALGVMCNTGAMVVMCNTGDGTLGGSSATQGMGRSVGRVQHRDGDARWVMCNIGDGTLGGHVMGRVGHTGDGTLGGCVQHGDGGSVGHTGDGTLGGHVHTGDWGTLGGSCATQGMGTLGGSCATQGMGTLGGSCATQGMGTLGGSCATQGMGLVGHVRGWVVGHVQHRGWGPRWVMVQHRDGDAGGSCTQGMGRNTGDGECHTGYQHN
nr:circumsporozoite protein-like [Penaeus vannamei]